MLIFSKIGPLKAKKFQKIKNIFKMKIFKMKIFKLRYLGPGKGFRGPLKGYLSKITYISVRHDSFREFSKFELSRSNFPRKTHFSGASCVA